ncbi:hypothetical protein GCM10010156_74390 [Planobispora rosea]|uniref:Methyl-accepting chemotaxis protein n=1 Tax=Planobispora rosea TaxID=35762 RepID=A0A8J3S8H7_PLARO|nr:methyl-accepting chemotaxis protein [Planobispora rosea]GGT05945.1 hypothetical protein GCM10010156_74390 [Planobispora rosea]GIH88665.1 hypothetical protein Pro02_70730 [Planobispora rosea]
MEEFTEKTRTRTTGSWLNNRPVRGKLALIVGIALLGLAATAGIGVGELVLAEERARDLETSAKMTRMALEADMAHDAIRGDVLRIMVATDDAERAQARDDLAEHSSAMREKLAYFTGPQVPASVHRAAGQAAPAVDDYLELAEVAAGDPGAETYGRFSEAFTTVEEGLPAIGDALDAHAATVVATVADQRREATWTLVGIGVLAAVLLAGVARLVGQGILRPLREVSAVLAAMASGDLSRRAEVTSADEIGAMARMLDTAIGGVQETVDALKCSATSVAASAERMTQVSRRIASSAEETSDQAEAVAGAARTVESNIATTARGNEEIGAATVEISRSTTSAVGVVGEAVAMAERANTIMTELDGSSAEIGSVVKAISMIAGQTNLLALNATIEAARAGEAGKGFAVVAGEVKDLAQETARATEDISRRVESIQAGTADAVEAISQIAAVIARINEFQTTIASAMEQQSSTTTEMTRHMGEAVRRGGEIGESIATIAATALATSEDAATSMETARELSSMAERLRELAARFR